MKVNIFRKQYPKFIYRSYSYKISKNNLEIFFDFLIEPNIHFKPRIVIEKANENQIKRVGERVLNNLVFHLGLMEIPSYWKATCSSEIIIKAGSLNSEQIKWWKWLIINGLGQFFYENKIDFRRPNFVKIFNFPRPDFRQAGGDPISAKLAETRSPSRGKNRVLVPIGGGKDSIVTLEKLKEQKKEINAFALNPGKVTRDVLRVTGIKNPIIVERKIDPLLLKLNRQGYLNGHTPFTAVLSFLSAFCAVLFDYKQIAFSNEKSADEGNVKYLGKIINHQWSKSSEFEKKFRDYCQKYLVKGVNYFSFLRKYTELEIARMFSKYPRYFSVFSSCNLVLAKKLKKRWCGNCPKCLFIYATLYPFLEKKELLKIFGTDIFENKKLLPTMRQLIGERGFKPFECVGTKKESQIAFYLSWKKYILRTDRGRASIKLPFLLKYFEKNILPKYPKLEKELRK